MQLGAVKPTRLNKAIFRPEMLVLIMEVVTMQRCKTVCVATIHSRGASQAS